MTSRFLAFVLRCLVLSSSVVAVCVSTTEIARAAMPSVYTITDIDVDVTDTDATSAKMKAIGEAQVKAFAKLVDRIADEGAAKKLAWLKPDQIGRMMSALSVQEEKTGPGRYIAKLTISFLPAKVRSTFAKQGIGFTEKVAPKTLLLPVWNAPDGAVLWGETPWLKVWTDLKADQTVVPLVLAKGDETDQQAVTVADAINGDETKLDALKARYEADSVLVAIGEPSGDNGVHMKVVGDTPVGRVLIDKTYTADQGGADAAAQAAAARLVALMTQKWKQTNPYSAPRPVAAAQSMSVSVPLASAAQFSAVRSRLVATPGVTGVDVSSIQAGGALIKLSYQSSIEALQAALEANRLRLTLVSGSWVLQAY
ncbi:MAG: DUF2066 domain-containing protein [Hyphomicrobiales bacterium]